MNYPWYYVMAAKGIQQFILQGDKLRLMIGGSELVDGLPNAFLNDLLKGLDLTEEVDYQVLSRAAGGARLLFANETPARQLARIMPLAVSSMAPGVDVVQDVTPVSGSLAATMSHSEQRLQQRRNRLFPTYPVAGPLVDRAPRSGLPVVGVFHSAKGNEPADRAMQARSEASRRTQQSLLQKVAGEDAADLAIQENLEDLLGDEREYVAVLHADGNGLGLLIRALLEELQTRRDPAGEADAYRAFSQAIERATFAALRSALAPLVAKTRKRQEREPAKKVFLPFRPLICAGDDVTLILRAPDALAVAETFLQQFKACAAAELAQVDSPVLKDCALTASAGIAFVHRNFPFSQAYQLCESLCKYAKNATQRKASALAFWRVTATVADDIDTIVTRELTPEANVCLTMMPYQVDDVAGIPRLDDLKHLMDALDNHQMPRGSVRELLTRMYESRTAADQAWQRIAEVARTGRHRGAFERFEAALQTLTANPEAPLWRRQPDGRTTPLHDAIELLAVMDNPLKEKGDA